MMSKEKEIHCRTFPSKEYKRHLAAESVTKVTLELEVTRDQQKGVARLHRGLAVSFHEKEMPGVALSVMCNEHIKIAVGFSLVAFFLRYLTRVPFQLKLKKKCTNCILMPGELTLKREEISPISAGVQR